MPAKKGAQTSGRGVAQNAQQTKDNILAAGRRVMRNRHWSGVTIMMIARDAYVSPPTFYLYYGKRSLRSFTFEAFAENCALIIAACNEATSSRMFVEAIATHVQGPARAIAAALNPVIYDPWSREELDDPESPFDFQSLATQLATHILREHAEGDCHISAASADVVARTTLNTLLDALFLGDDEAIKRICLM